jgi:hypothetical protein
LSNRPFVHIAQIKLPACEPATEITYHPKTPPGALSTMPFLQQA